MIPIAEPSLGEAELKNLQECIKSGWISYKGPFVKQFEEKVAEYVGAKYGVACSSGTAALHLALLSLDVEPGDEVIVPTLTFIATANAVRYCSAKPVFVDSDSDYWCMNPSLIEEKITERTAGILPVHLYGHPCNMDAILGIAKRYKLWVVEDCAEVLGAEYKGKKVGLLGNVGCFSFFTNKVATTGEGGMCLTDSKELADRIRILSDHGTTPGKPYWHDVVGYNYRITNIQAAVGVAQMERINELLIDRQRVRRLYESLLPLELIRMPWMSWAKPINWQYTVLFQNREQKVRAASYLKSEGIETRPMFYLITDMPPYKTEERFPIAEDLSRRGLSLPSFPNLTEKQIYYICDCIREVL